MITSVIALACLYAGFKLGRRTKSETRYMFWR